MIHFRVRRKGYYSANMHSRSETMLLADLARDHPDMDWERYQELYDKLSDENPGWSPFSIHRRLASRKQLWSSRRPQPMTDAELQAADEAYAKLPDGGDAEKAINWAITHPKFFRSRQLEPGAVGVSTAVTAKDIVSPCHGTAPSKLAVAYLQQALAKGDKFVDTILGEQKKTTGKGGAPSDTADAWGEATDEEMGGIFDDGDEDSDETDADV